MTFAVKGSSFLWPGETNKKILIQWREKKCFTDLVVFIVLFLFKKDIYGSIFLEIQEMKLYITQNRTHFCIKQPFEKDLLFSITS